MGDHEVFKSRNRHDRVQAKKVFSISSIISKGILKIALHLILNEQLIVSGGQYLTVAKLQRVKL